MTEIIGHDNVTIEILKMLNSQKLHNALIFSGLKGIGKYSYAYDLSQFILSHNFEELSQAKNITDINPSVSYLIKAGSHEGFIYIKPSGKTLKEIIAVDDIRQINTSLSLTIEINKYRIVIIDALENLNINSSNALLKLLEDTPKNTIFILISHNYDSVLPTIKSRCLNLKFKSLSKDNLEILAKNNGLILENNTKNALLSLANGSFSKLQWFYLPQHITSYKTIYKATLANTSEADIYKVAEILKLSKDLDIDIIFDILTSITLNKAQSINVETTTDILSKIFYYKEQTNILNLDKIQIILAIIFLVQGL